MEKLQIALLWIPFRPFQPYNRLTKVFIQDGIQEDSINHYKKWNMLEILGDGFPVLFPAPRKIPASIGP